MESLSKILECQICMNQFDMSQFKPFTLTCGHTLCLQCVKQLDNNRKEGRIVCYEYVCSQNEENIESCLPTMHSVISLLESNAHGQLQQKMQSYRVPQQQQQHDSSNKMKQMEYIRHLQIALNQAGIGLFIVRGQSNKSRQQLSKLRMIRHIVQAMPLIVDTSHPISQLLTLHCAQPHIQDRRDPYVVFNKKGKATLILFTMIAVIGTNSVLLKTATVHFIFQKSDKIERPMMTPSPLMDSPQQSQLEGGSALSLQYHRQ